MILKKKKKKKNTIKKDFWIVESKFKKLNKEIYNLRTENEIIKNQLSTSSIELENKDKIIEELEYRLNYSNNQLLNENINENQINQLLIERKELIKQNTNLRKGYAIFNINIKEANELYNQKTQTFSNIIHNYSMKLNEYKNKIIQLKKKVNELYNKNNKLKLEIDSLKFNKQKLKEENSFDNKSPKRSPSSPSFYQRNSFNNLSRNKSLSNSYKKHYYRNIYSNIDNYSMNHYNNFQIDNSNNSNSIYKDPFFDSQQKSLSDFKRTLLRIEMELSKNKEIQKENNIKEHI